MTETEARTILSIECQEIIHKAFDSAGRLIAQAVFDRGDDYEGIYEDARSIVSAVVMETTYIRRG